jgi:hypothetical protein
MSILIRNKPPNFLFRVYQYPTGESALPVIWWDRFPLLVRLSWAPEIPISLSEMRVLASAPGGLEPFVLGLPTSAYIPR